MLCQGETIIYLQELDFCGYLRDHDLITVAMSKQKSDLFSNITVASKNRNDFLALKKIVCKI